MLAACGGERRQKWGGAETQLALYAQQERNIQQLGKTMLDDMDPNIQLSVKYPRVSKK